VLESDDYDGRRHRRLIANRSSRTPDARDEVSDDRLDRHPRRADLTDDEAPDRGRGRACAATTRPVYPITVEMIPKPVLEDADDIRQALETALTGVAGLLANWERGDLAGQVHALQGWAEDTFTKFPDLDAERWIEAADLRPGDLVDMQGVYAEDTADGHAAEFEYCRVIETERERPDLVRVDFDGAASFGFDPFRWVKAVCTAKARAEWAPYPNDPDDGHEHDFEAAEGSDVPGAVVCKLCGLLSVEN
jgi:hypothetical protein